MAVPVRPIWKGDLNYQKMGLPLKIAVYVHFRQSIHPRDIVQLRQDRAYARLC